MPNCWNNEFHYYCWSQTQGRSGVKKVHRKTSVFSLTHLYVVPQTLMKTGMKSTVSLHSTHYFHLCSQMIFKPMALSTQRFCIIGAVKTRLHTAFVCLHWTRQRPLKACCRCRTKRGGTVHIINIEIWVLFFFPRCFPRCPTVNLNMYPLTAYNHIDAVIMWLNPDSPCIVDSEKVKFLLYMTSHNHHQ